MKVLIPILIGLLGVGCGKPPLVESAAGEYISGVNTTLILSKGGKAKIVYDPSWDPAHLLGAEVAKAKTVDCNWSVEGEDIILRRGNEILETYRLEENGDLILLEGLTEEGRRGVQRRWFIWNRQAKHKKKKSGRH